MRNGIIRGFLGDNGNVPIFAWNICTDLIHLVIEIEWQNDEATVEAIQLEIEGVLLLMHENLDLKLFG